MTEYSAVPDDLLYSPEHEWLRLEEGLARIGITAYAQDQLGDVVYVDLPRPGTQVSFMTKFGEIESVKVASELFAPVSGEIVEINTALASEPELVNNDPFGRGWLVTVRVSEPDEIKQLLEPSAYRDLVEKEQGIPP